MSENTSRVLALDIGTRMGWALSVRESGTWDFKRSRYEGGGMIFLRFRQTLSKSLESGVKAVFFEEVRRHLGTDAAHLYGGFVAILTEECEKRGIPYLGIPVATIKQHATGKGNANKEAMVEAARARWGTEITIVDDNHADALFLWDYVSRNHHVGHS